MKDGGDEVWSRAEVDSPCVKVCVLHPTAKLCIGCHRSGDEIARWSSMSDADRAAIRAALPAREAVLAAHPPADRPGRRRNRRFGGPR